MLEFADTRYEGSVWRRHGILEVSNGYSFGGDDGGLGIISDTVDETFTYDNIHKSGVATQISRLVVIILSYLMKLGWVACPEQLMGSSHMTTWGR